MILFCRLKGIGRPDMPGFFKRLLEVGNGVIYISVCLALTQAQIIVEHICNLLPCGFRQFGVPAATLQKFTLRRPFSALLA